MQRRASTVPVLRIACGSVQAVAGGATMLLATRLGGFGAADAPPMLSVMVLAAGAATLVQGMVGLASAALARLPRPR